MIIPAATLVLMRDRPAGPPEILLVERAASMAFAAGALVFPGGRIDTADHAVIAPAAAAADNDDDERPARVAAIRETIEEVGLAIGLSPLPSIAVLAAIRRRLVAGEPLEATAAQFGIGVDPVALTSFARWLPDHPGRRYDTRFFIAPAPRNVEAATIDGTENHRLLWITAAGALAMAERGEAAIIYPTHRNLERLARYRSTAEAIEDARRTPVRTITPFVAVRDGVDSLCIPKGLGYPVTHQALATVRRG